MTKCLKFCSLIVLVLFFGTIAEVHPKSSLDYGPSEARWVKRTIAKMTLEEKIGQMLCLGFYGDFTNDTSETWIKYKHWVEDLKIGTAKRALCGYQYSRQDPGLR